MKYLKTFENITKDTYVLFKNSKGEIGILETNIKYKNYEVEYSDGIMCKVIFPNLSQIFKMYHTDISENEYECENYLVWQFLYESKNLEDVKERYEMYIQSNKYNL